METILKDHCQRLKVTDPKFKPGFIGCDLGEKIFYIDDKGRDFVDVDVLNGLEIINENVHEEKSYKDPGLSGSGRGNWRNHRKRAIQKKRVRDSS